MYSSPMSRNGTRRRSRSGTGLDVWSRRKSTRSPVGFAGVDPPRDVAAFARAGPPISSARSTRCPAWQDDARRLAKLGLRTVRDLLEHAPFRYVGASADLEPLRRGRGSRRSRAPSGACRSASPRRRMSIVEATVSDESGQIRATWFNQPWVAEQLRPGTRLRLIGSVRRGTFAVRTHEPASEHADLVPVYPGERGRHPEEAARARARGAPARRRGPAARSAETAGRSSVEGRRAARTAPAALARGGRTGARTPRVRGAARAPARHCTRARAARSDGGDGARRAGRAARALPGRAAVRADRASGARDRRDRRATSPARCRCSASCRATWLGQDGRRALRASARRRDANARAR